MTANMGGPGDSARGPQFLVVGRVLRPHGVRGELRLQALTGFPERMRRLDVIFLGTDPEAHDDLAEYRVTRIRPEKQAFWLAHLDGITDRDAADRLRGQYVLVSLADAIPLEDDEVYLFQVIGLEVRTVEGEALGVVAEILETGANDVYIVRGEQYGEVLIPAIEDVVLRISPEEGVMIVRLLPGLLPE
jgi:16S rRNA processing protein RimM